MSSQTINSQKLRLHRLTLNAVLIALALGLSIVERWIPLDLIVPVPGIKLGLANIVTLFALLRLRPLDAFIILLIRCLVMGAITGPTTLLFSLCGGLLALLLMWLLCRWEGRFVSVIGISLAGAAAHNIGQVTVAGFLLSEPLLLLTYLPPLLLTSLATGVLTGVAALPVIRVFKPIPTVGGSVMKSVCIFVLSLCLLSPMLTGCTPQESTTAASTGEYQKFTYEFTGTFDTVISFIGYNRTQAEFDRLAGIGEARFRQLNEIYDAYNDYPGINNVKTINDQAGLAPVKVEPELLDLITKSIEWNLTISDKTNIAIGDVIRLWQEYRDRALADPSQAAVPSSGELATVLATTDLNKIMIDQSASTVFLSDVKMKLDLGAVAKGYAAELVAQELIAVGATSMIINAGGSNVRMIGKPMDDRTSWSVGLQNPSALLADDPNAAVTPGAPEPAQIIAVLDASDTSIVTSGDYQRFYIVNGVVYHHLIDPSDGMPARYYRAVTVVTKDSGLADFLSTALFLLPYEQSRALVDSLPDVEALWIFDNSRIEMTTGLGAMAQQNK